MINRAWRLQPDPLPSANHHHQRQAQKRVHNVNSRMNCFHLENQEKKPSSSPKKIQHRHQFPEEKAICQFIISLQTKPADK